MIGYIEGIVKEILGDSFYIVTNTGVGYEVHCKPGAFLAGDIAQIYIHTHVREQEISLWGFNGVEELAIFRLLIGVSGIGVKTAFNLINEKGAGQVVQSIIMGEESGLKVSGIGKKTVQKLILELKDKVSEFNNMQVTTEVGQTVLFEANTDLVNTMESLGYRRFEVDKALENLMQTAESNAQSFKALDLQDQVKQLLRYI